MKEIIIVADYTDDSTLTLQEVCEACGIETVLLQEFVTYEVILPAGREPDEWIFDMAQLKRLRTALRLQRDFELNVAGVALVLHLLEDMDNLREMSAIYQKHLLK